MVEAEEHGRTLDLDSQGGGPGGRRGGRRDTQVLGLAFPEAKRKLNWVATLGRLKMADPGIEAKLLPV